MARSNHIIDTLKLELRSQGINYRELAQRLELSESTIKHMFSSKNFSLKRMDMICELLGIELSDLVSQYEARTPKIEQLSTEHEKQLVSDVPLLLVAYCVTNQWSIADILTQYNLSEPECIRCLVQLDRMKMIELLPENKFKLLISANFKWHPNGPIEQFFRRETQERFFSGSFSGDDASRIFKLGDLSNKSIMQLIDRIDSVAELYDELNREDRKQPFGASHGTSMVLAIRKWKFDAFSAYEK